MKTVTIAIPIYNEEAVMEQEIRALHAALQRAPRGFDYRIFLVENGSKDKTKEIAGRLSRELNGVSMVSLPIAGYGLAIKAGITMRESDYTVIFNIDFWDLEFMRQALGFLEGGGIDIVVGSKTMPGAKDERSLKRRFTTKAFNAFLRLAFGFKGTDTHGMKAFDWKKIIPIVRQCKTDREIFDTELLLRAQYAGLRTKELPVQCVEKRPSNLGGFFRLVRRTLKDIVVLFWVLRRR